MNERKPGTVIDTYDAAAEEWMSNEESGDLDSWHGMTYAKRLALEAELVSINIMDGHWFRWSDGTVRDWPEN